MAERFISSEFNRFCDYVNNHDRITNFNLRVTEKFNMKAVNIYRRKLTALGFLKKNKKEGVYDRVKLIPDDFTSKDMLKGIEELCRLKKLSKNNNE